MNTKKIGMFLKEIRKEKGLTQEQLAELIGVSGRTVSRWETGTNMPDLSILIQLADYYEVEIRDILNGERKSEMMNHELKETLSKVADYSNFQKEKARRAGNTAFGVMFAICVAAIIIQMMISIDLKLVLGETVILVAGGIVYIIIMIHNGMWEMGSRFKSTTLNDILIAVICSGIFSVIFALLLLKRNGDEIQIYYLSFLFFVGTAILGFIVLRILSIYSKRKKIKS